MNIGFVIVNYNDLTNTKKLIHSIEEYQTIKKIVVVDNNSTDTSCEELKKIRSEKLTIIANKDNKGYAYALNQGAKLINSELDNAYICISNSDICIPNEEVIITMAKTIDKNIKCVMPKIKEGDTFKYGWKLTTKYDDLLANIPFFNRFYRDKFLSYSANYFQQEKAYVDVIYGCFFMIEGSTLASIDYFDENTFLYYEENILARKLDEINKYSMVNTTVYAEHIHDASIGTNMSLKKKYKIYKKSQLYYERHYNKANIFDIILFKIFYYINLIPYVFKK